MTSTHGGRVVRQEADNSTYGQCVSVKLTRAGRISPNFADVKCELSRGDACLKIIFVIVRYHCRNGEVKQAWSWNTDELADVQPKDELKFVSAFGGATLVSVRP